MGKENLDFGKNLKQIRLNRGLTQSQLASFLNVSDRTVSSWESGRTEPSIAMIDLLCDYLHCTKKELLGESSKVVYTLPKITADMLFARPKYSDILFETEDGVAIIEVLNSMDQKQIKRARKLLDIIVNEEE